MLSLHNHGRGDTGKRDNNRRNDRLIGTKLRERLSIVG